MAPLETKWQSNFASGYEITSILANNNGVYTAKNGAAFRLEGNGSVTASNNLPGTGYNEVRLAAPDDGSLLVAGTNGYVDAQSLQAQWTTDLPDSGYHVTNVSCVNGRVYAGCNGHLYRLNISNGNVEAHNPLSKEASTGKLLNRNDLSGVGSQEVRLALDKVANMPYAGTNGYGVGLQPNNVGTVYSTSLPDCGYNVTDVVCGNGNAFYACVDTCMKSMVGERGLRETISMGMGRMRHGLLLMVSFVWA